MICGSCYRRVDAERSFCAKCGSAVFVAEGDRAWRANLERWQRAVDAAEQAAGAASTATNRVWAGRSSRPSAATGTGAIPPAIGCLGSLVRLAAFTALVWFAFSWLLSIPEVERLKDAALSGTVSDDQAREAIEAVVERIRAAVGASPASR